MDNLKDKLTAYAAIAFSTGTAILGLPFAISSISPDLAFTLPSVVNTIAVILIAASILITQVLTGKNPDGTTKTTKQVNEALSKK